MIRSSPFAASADHRLLLPKTSSFHFSNRLLPLTSESSNVFVKAQTYYGVLPSLSTNSRRLYSPFVCYARSSTRSDEVKTVKEVSNEGEGEKAQKEVARISNGDENLGFMSVGVGNPSLVGRMGLIRMSLGDQAFFLTAFIAATTSIAFSSLMIAAIPLLFALKRTAKSIANLADTACVELPSTMAAIRLSGLEISDLTVELSDLSQEIVGGVSKSTQAVRAAGAGIKHVGALAHEKTMSIIEERANLPEIKIQPFVAGAARKTSHAVGQVAKNLVGFLSQNGESVKEKPSTSAPKKQKPSTTSSKNQKPSVSSLKKE